MKVKVPFSFTGYEEGKRVQIEELFAALRIYVRQIQRERDDLLIQVQDLTEELGERERDLDEANDYIQTMEDHLHEWYRPVNQYIYNGVSPNDF